MGSDCISPANNSLAWSSMLAKMSLSHQSVICPHYPVFMVLYSYHTIFAWWTYRPPSSVAWMSIMKLLKRQWWLHSWHTDLFQQTSLSMNVKVHYVRNREVSILITLTFFNEPVAGLLKISKNGVESTCLLSSTYSRPLSHRMWNFRYVWNTKVVILIALTFFDEPVAGLLKNFKTWNWNCLLAPTTP